MPCWHELSTRYSALLLALNRLYLPNPMFKWQKYLISELDVVPEQFAERLQFLATRGSPDALREAETLMADTAQLVKARYRCRHCFVL